MTIQILGSGCKKCSQLAANADAAARAMGVEYELVKVTDFADIARMGVLTTPALAVDGKVKLIGKVADPEEIRAILDAARA
jgi:small redox-active disulfide protein 2